MIAACSSSALPAPDLAWLKAVGQAGCTSRAALGCISTCTTSSRSVKERDAAGQRMSVAAAGMLLQQAVSFHRHIWVYCNSISANRTAAQYPCSMAVYADALQRCYLLGRLHLCCRWSLKQVP